MPTVLNPHAKILLTLMRLWLGLLNEDVADRFKMSPTKYVYLFLPLR